MNVHVARFGRDIERATARLVANQQIGACPTVQAYLALYGAMALVRNAIEGLDREDAEANREVV